MCQAQSVSSSRHNLQSEAHTGYWKPTNIILFTLFTNTVKPLYSEQSRDPKNVHYTGVFTQEGWDMFMHTCATNAMYTCILKLTYQIYLIFDSLISLNLSSKFKFFRFADMLTKTD